MMLYMHTLDGRPASYTERCGLCYERKGIRLATSLRQIRREQATDKRRRIGEGFLNETTYGYVTVLSSASTRNTRT